MRIRVVHVIVILLLSMPFGVAQTTSLTGNWTGESICVGNNRSCHDEKVVYHISVDPADSTKVKIAADKIVDGKPEPMGVIDLKYDPGKQSLTGETQTARYRLWWEIVIKGNVMECMLSVLPDKTIARRIKVQKNESPKESSMTQHATGTFEVKLTPQDDKSDDKSMGRMTIEKQWQGDLEGASKGQMLTGGDFQTGSAGYVAVEKFTGTLKGQKGSFILQHSAT